jgi:energy-coupling factor transporter ATP-binding protein EcfA2
MIEVTDLTVHYGERPALEDVSFTVGRGEFVLLSGPSGCGKSTLARALNGLIPHAWPHPSTTLRRGSGQGSGHCASSARVMGRVVVDGLETAAHSLPELAAHVGLVFQNPATQLFNATVEEEIAFAPRNLGLPAEEVVARVAFALDAVGISPLRGRAIRTLSSGEQQRVAIASVLALRPQVLVLDEPTSNLDWQGVEQVMSTLARLNREEGLTILVIEHRLQAVVSLADRVLLMQGGRIVADGRPEDVFGENSEWRMANDGGERMDDREWRVEVAGGEANPPPPPFDGVYPEQGRRAQGRPPSYPSPPSVRPLVAIQGLEAGYGRQTVLQGLDLALYPGEFAALVGDNGVGKSTLAKVLAGLLRPRRGRITWNKKLRRLPLGRRVGFLFQNPLDQLVCDTVEEEIAFGPRNLGLPPSQMRERLETTLAVAGLMALRRRRSAALSVGEQQRTALAAALSTAPHLLILDEPTMGQDWAHLSRLMESLTQLNHDGQAILLITHDDELVCRYARRIILLEEGRIAAEYDNGQGEFNGQGSLKPGIRDFATRDS